MSVIVRTPGISRASLNRDVLSQSRAGIVSGTTARTYTRMRCRAWATTRASSATLAREQEHIGCRLMINVTPDGFFWSEDSAGQASAAGPVGPGRCSYLIIAYRPAPIASTQTDAMLPKNNGRIFQAKTCSVRHLSNA